MINKQELHFIHFVPLYNKLNSSKIELFDLIKVIILTYT